MESGQTAEQVLAEMEWLLREHSLEPLAAGVPADVMASARLLKEDVG